MKKVELLAPAGTIEKLKYAVHYGADAVYLGGKKLGLRAFAGNFTLNEMEAGVRYAHKRNVKVYLTMNVFPRNTDFEGLGSYLGQVQEIGVDGIIAADLGLIHVIREKLPKMPLHLSTQANCTNYQSALFWKANGMERIVLARELALPEIREIKKRSGLEIETFIHGAMCISYSGRCLLSNYMAGRDSNKGECAQSCRWNYNLVEEKRPGEYYPVLQDDRGTYVFNSQDMCLFSHIHEIIDAGVDSLKIEGRMKSLYYVATIVRAYRKIIDQYYQPREDFAHSYWRSELDKVSHRPYTTGFYFGEMDREAAFTESSTYIQPYDFVGIVREYDPLNKMAVVEQRNNFKKGDTLELFGPQGEDFSFRVDSIWSESGYEMDVVPTPKTLVKIPVPREVRPMDLLRREVKDGGIRKYLD